MNRIHLSESSYLIPDWPAPDNIVALCTRRPGGASKSPYDSFNQAMHVGDDPMTVEANRRQLTQNCEGLSSVQWLEQVHSDLVVEASLSEKRPEADACFSSEESLACAVMTADCLSLLICDEQGSQVAAAHAGWRGLVDGVIEQTVSSFRAKPAALLVWLGPAISQAHFEVGPEVREQFLAAAGAACSQTEQAFIASARYPERYMADLYQLARIRLQALGVERIYGGEYCTYRDHLDFYSYRRDGVTGRMVSLIYRLPGR